ncbi:MAG: hypothetical protein L3J56_10825 [Bacteroidales bacterium]|nr:hypothetical protein [Bacteroidales bacterium]
MKRTLIDPDKIRAWFFDRRIEKTIKKANKLQEVTKSKHIVLLIGGKPRIYKKRDLRRLINMRVFGKIKLEQLLKYAVHETTT